MDIENWRDLINEAQHTDVEIDYDGIYDAHLRAQEIVGPDPVAFDSAELIKHRHRKRQISNNRTRLNDDLNDPTVDIFGQKQGGGSGPSKEPDLDS